MLVHFLDTIALYKSPGATFSPIDLRVLVFLPTTARIDSENVQVNNLTCVIMFDDNNWYFYSIRFFEILYTIPYDTGIKNEHM